MIGFYIGEYNFYLLLNNWNATYGKKWLWNVLLGFLKWYWRFTIVIISWSMNPWIGMQTRTKSKPKLSSVAEIEFLYWVHRVKLQLSSKWIDRLFLQTLRKNYLRSQYFSLCESKFKNCIQEWWVIFDEWMSNNFFFVWTPTLTFEFGWSERVNDGELKMNQSESRTNEEINLEKSKNVLEWFMTLPVI